MTQDKLSPKYSGRFSIDQSSVIDRLLYMYMVNPPYLNLRALLEQDHIGARSKRQVFR